MALSFNFKEKINSVITNIQGVIDKYSELDAIGERILNSLNVLQLFPTVEQQIDNVGTSITGTVFNLSSMAEEDRERALTALSLVGDKIAATYPDGELYKEGVLKVDVNNQTIYFNGEPVMTADIALDLTDPTLEVNKFIDGCLESANSTHSMFLMLQSSVNLAIANQLNLANWSSYVGDLYNGLSEDAKAIYRAISNSAVNGNVDLASLYEILKSVLINVAGGQRMSDGTWKFADNEYELRTFNWFANFAVDTVTVAASVCLAIINPLLGLIPVAVQKIGEAVSELKKLSNYTINPSAPNHSYAVPLVQSTIPFNRVPSGVREKIDRLGVVSFSYPGGSGFMWKMSEQSSQYGFEAFIDVQFSPQYLSAAGNYRTANLLSSILSISYTDNGPTASLLFSSIQEESSMSIAQAVDHDFLNSDVYGSLYLDPTLSNFKTVDQQHYGAAIELNLAINLLFVIYGYRRYLNANYSDFDGSVSGGVLSETNRTLPWNLARLLARTHPSGSDYILESAEIESIVESLHDLSVDGTSVNIVDLFVNGLFGVDAPLTLDSDTGYYSSFSSVQYSQHQFYIEGPEYSAGSLRTAIAISAGVIAAAALATMVVKTKIKKFIVNNTIRKKALLDKASREYANNPTKENAKKLSYSNRIYNRWNKRMTAISTPLGAPSVPDVQEDTAPLTYTESDLTRIIELIRGPSV